MKKDDKNKSGNPRPKTIDDLAKIAGVASSTVSRALNDSPLISDKTKKKIRDLALQYNIRIHQGARNLRLKQTGIIGLVTYYLETDDFGQSDPFDLQMIGAISVNLKKHGYDMLFIQAGLDDDDWPSRYYLQNRVDGFILLCFGQRKDLIDQLLKIQAPFVVFGNPLYNNRYGGVMSDNREGSRLATAHLLDSGKTDLAFIGGPAQNQEVLERLEGFKAAFEEHDIRPDERLIKYGDYSGKSSAVITEQLLDSNIAINGIVITSDVMAISAMGILQERKIKIPDDIAVTGFDGIPLTAYTSPPLTTVTQNIGLIGTLLVEHITNKINTGQISHTIVPTQLVIRESTTV